MADHPPRFRRVLMLGLVPLGLVAGGGYALIRTSFPQLFADHSVYSVDYSEPKGWKEIPPGPFTLFVFREPTGRGTLRASVNEVQSRTNPTPELDTDGIANHYVELTRANMPDWSAERLSDHKDGSERFSVIKRSKKDRTVYTAFCVKGNTTVVVSLTAGGASASSVESLLPDFRSLMSSFKLTPKTVELDE